MLNKIREKATYANVMSTLAIFLILGGATAWAAKKIGAKRLKTGAASERVIRGGAVTNSKIGSSAVTNSKIGTDAVSNSKIANGAVSNSNLATNSVSNSKIQDNSIDSLQIRSETISNPKLRDGVVNSRVLGSVVQRPLDVTLPMAGTTATQTSPCAAGEKLLGGGAEITNDDVGTDKSAVIESGPLGNAWFAKGYSAPLVAADRNMRVWAICLVA